MKIDEAIANAREKAKEIRENIIDGDNLEPYESYCITMADKSAEEHEQIAEWLEKLKTIESIMLTYNANWYADEDNGVPDCEVLESIWNVIQDNGLDIDIEQDYRKGKADGYNKAIDDCKELTFREVVYYDSINDRTEFRELAEQLKEDDTNE